MLSKIRIQGFKCFDSEELNLGKLTLLTGINSAGKSSALQALLLLMQQEENGKSPFNGKYVHLGVLEEVKNWITNPRKICIEGEYNQCLCSMCIDMEEKVQITGYENLPKELVYLSAERVGVEDVYQQNLINEYKIGIHGEFSFDYLSVERLNLLKEREFAIEEAGINFGNQVDYWLNYITGYFVTAERIQGTEIVRVSYRRSESGSRNVKPCHVGTGVSYVANVIIAALSCKRGSIFVVENPEIHLHPGAQSKLLEFICYLAARGLQVIVETHSDHIFNGVRTHIKKRKIATEEVQVYYFVQDENHLSKPIEIEIDENGVIRNQEKGLFDQFDEDLDELLGL